MIERSGFMEAKMKEEDIERHIGKRRKLEHIPNERAVAKRKRETELDRKESSLLWDRVIKRELRGAA
jgi:hypothetical protein